MYKDIDTVFANFYHLTSSITYDIFICGENAAFFHFYQIIHGLILNKKLSLEELIRAMRPIWM
jgi:hypothetical protein